MLVVKYDLTHYKEPVRMSHMFGNWTNTVVLCIWLTKKNCLVRVIHLGIGLYCLWWMFWFAKKDWFIRVSLGIGLYLCFMFWLTTKNQFVGVIYLGIWLALYVLMCLKEPSCKSHSFRSWTADCAVCFDSVKRAIWFIHSGIRWFLCCTFNYMYEIH